MWNNGREEFVERVKDWKQEYGNSFTKLFSRIGTGLDWLSECFTLDALRSRGEKEGLIRL